MIKKIYLPLWAQYCIKENRIEYKELDDGTFVVINCHSIRECYGCNPIGASLPINPTKLKLIDEFCSMDFSVEECKDGIWLTNTILKNKLSSYEASEELFFYWRGISGDLDTVRIWSVKHSPTSLKIK